MTMATIWPELFFTQTGELAEVLSRVDGRSLDALTDTILSAPTIVTAGRGRSGLVMQGFAMRLMHLDKEAHVLGDATTPAAQPNDLMLLGSGSGATSSLVSAVEQARQIGVRTALVTINPDSPIGRTADLVVRIPAPSPKADDAESIQSVQPMGSLFEQSLGLLLDAVIIRLMGLMNVTAEQMFARHANIE